MPDKRDQTALQPGVLRKRKGEFDHEQLQPHHVPGERQKRSGRQAEDPQSVSVQDKACLYDRVIPFGEIATLLKAREDQGNDKT